MPIRYFDFAKSIYNVGNLDFLRLTDEFVFELKGKLFTIVCDGCGGGKSISVDKWKEVAPR